MSNFAAQCAMLDRKRAPHHVCVGRDGEVDHARDGEDAKEGPDVRDAGENVGLLVNDGPDVGDVAVPKVPRVLHGALRCGDRVNQ